jgi:hypothetical protein
MKIQYDSVVRPQQPTENRTKALSQALGTPWLGGIVVIKAGAIELLVENENIWQVPAERLLT